MDFDWMSKKLEENGDVILQLEKERDALRAERDWFEDVIGTLRVENERLTRLLSGAVVYDTGAAASERQIHKRLVEMGWTPPNGETRGQTFGGHEHDALPTTEELGTSLKEAAGQESEWLTHNSNQPPDDLAPAQLVELQAPTTGGVFAVRRVDELPWHPDKRYRPALSADGLPLCSAEGLEPSSHYVFTPSSGFPGQCPDKPEYRSDGLWFASGWSYAPSTHRKPGDPVDSLMEVYRE